MDNYLIDINYLIYSEYMYNCFPKGTSIEHCDDCIMIKNQEKQFQVTLWNSKIIEFQSFRENVIDYYLHFEFKDFFKANKLFKEFLSFCKRKYNDKIQILVCCTNGYTSTYFTEGLKEYIKAYCQNIHIEACSYTKIEEYVNKYDLILLAPQIHYLHFQYVKYNNVFMIPTNIYATYNYHEALHIIQEKLSKL